LKKRKLERVKADLWEICKKRVRERDSCKPDNQCRECKHEGHGHHCNQPFCQRCGKPVNGRQAETSHVISKGKCGNHLRFDLNNNKVLCTYCHSWWHGHPIFAYEWFTEKFPKRMEYLDKRRRDQTKYGRQYLEDLLEEHRRLYG
jgi:hypothetical protein